MRCNYNLSYFNLWWKRMLREGEKEGKERVQREEASRRKEMLRRLLMKKKKKTALLSEVDEECMIMLLSVRYEVRISSSQSGTCML